MGVLYPATFVSGYNANPPPPVEPQIMRNRVAYPPLGPGGIEPAPIRLRDGV
jgi:hypothetical protein